MKEKNLTPKKKSLKKMRMIEWNPIEEDIAVGLYLFIMPCYLIYFLMHSCELS